MNEQRKYIVGELRSDHTIKYVMNEDGTTIAWCPFCEQASEHENDLLFGECAGWINCPSCHEDFALEPVFTEEDLKPRRKRS